MLTRTNVREIESLLKVYKVEVLSKEATFNCGEVDFIITIKVRNKEPKTLKYSKLLKESDFGGDIWSYFKEK